MEDVEVLRASVSSGAVAAVLVVTGAVTVCIQLLSVHPGPVPEPAPVVVYGAFVAAVWRYRATVKRETLAGFAAALAALQMLQVLWVASVSWAMPAHWSMASAGVMGSFLVAWAFLDAIQFRGSPRVRNLYLLGFASVVPYLLALDLLGQEGLLHRLEHAPEQAMQWGFVLALLAAITTAILTIVGGQERAAAERQAAAEQLLRERTALATERRSLGLVSRMLQGQVAAGRLRHDINSPLTVITATVGYLLEDAADPDTRAALEDLQVAGAAMKALIAALPTPADGPQASAIPVQDLLDDVDTSFRATLMGHGVTEASIDADLEPSDVWAGPEHVLSLASLLVNGRMQQPTPALTVTGTVLSPWYYRLQLRDFGVAPAEQTAARDRVRAGLRLETAADRDDTYRGLGLGLPLCKLQLASHGAWINVTTPADGPGLVLEVIVPRVAPEQIPTSERTPEVWVSGPQGMPPVRARA